MKKSLLKFGLFVALMCGGVSASAFTDVKLDLTNGNLLTEEEIGGAAVNFGVSVGTDGTPTRVAADDASANIVLSGKFHSNEHGWGNFSSTIAVEGPVKVSMGTCAWGGTVTIKNASGETVGTFSSNTGACFHNDKEANIASTYYKGVATTLTISGGSYTPYIAVEAVDPATLVEEVAITYSLGNAEAEGTLPEGGKAEVGSKITIPANHTLYLAGSTLTGWTDGENVYAPGQEVTVPATDLALTPVFTENGLTLADRTEPVTVRWDFQRQNGAPLLNIQGKTGIYVAQAEVNGKTIDVVLNYDTNNGGKLANGNWSDWAQCNSGTTFTVPSCKGAVISMEAYSNITTTTIDGMTDYAQGQTISYTIGGGAETVDVVIGDGSYYRYIQVVLPYIEPSLAGTTYTDEPAEVAWAFNSTADYADNYTVTPNGSFSTVSVNTGDLTITGAAGRTADNLAEGVNFIKFKPAGQTKAVEWIVKPAAGLTFTPTTVSMWIQRFGTDAQNGVVVTARTEGGESITLGTYTAPRANQDASKDKFAGNANWTNHVEIALTAAQQEALASADGFYLSATVGVGETKEGGFSDVHIGGKLNGTIADVNKYTVTAVANPEEAATISLYPNSAEYEEGAEVRITATKNFGYKFINWTDAEGNVVSDKNVFTTAVTSDLNLTANFEAVATYELNYSVDGGANLYMVTPAPAPTVVDGKDMYEDGTNVMLTAASNPILTFTNWSDGQTSGEITVTMDKDVEIVANYSAVDYLAGWDFILSGNNGRPADFASADNDAATLVLRDAEGNTVGWLDKSQASGGYEGRPGGVNWTTKELGYYYWQTKVNATAFTDLQIQTAMVYNYNAYQSYNVEYSLDGENWTALGSIDMPGTKSWTDFKASVPADANNKADVYFRVIADKSSAIDGTSSNNDGATIGATYITGKAQLFDDGTAPELVSTVPAEGATNASANGKVVLTFDEKVKVAEGAKATIGTQEVAVVATGKTVTAEYKGLEYSTEYTFTLPGGSVMDLTDNAITDDIVITFSTKSRPEIQKALYDFVVPTDGTFKEAIAAANSRADKSSRFRIFVMQGDYVLPVNEGSQVTGAGGKTASDSRTDLTASYVSIIGEGIDNTSIKNDCPDALIDGAYPAEGLRNCYTLHNSGTGTYIQDLRLVNGMPDNSGRGEAYEESGDKTILKNVGLWGYQDTYCSNNGRGRYYFEGGVVRGRTDYICGKDDIFFNGVEFRNVGTGGYIAVPSTPKEIGWILRDCKITAEDASQTNGKFTLGRPWGKGTPIALWINTTCEVVPSAIGWSEMSGGWPARFAEYNSTTASGSTIDLSGRKTVFADTHSNNPVLTAEEAAWYTISNVLAGEDDWDPTSYTEQASAPANVTIDEEGNLTWADSNYVLLWAVCKDGKVVDFTIEPAYTVVDTKAQWSVRAANEMGGLGEAAVAQSTTGVASVSAAAVVESAFYNVQGIRVNADYRGVVICVSKLANGTTITRKMINK